MSSVALQGNAGGSGAFVVTSPSSNNSRTLTLPDATTTIVGTDATQTLTNKTLTSPTLTTPNIDSAQVPTVSGSAPIYMCRAWCNFDGTLSGTITPRAGGNVTSITKNATGDYTINLTTAMPDINYSVSLVGNGAYGVDRSCHPAIFTNIAAATESTPTTSSFKVGFCNAAGTTGQDLKYITVAVFR